MVHAMKILFCSYAFPPSIGGIETVSSILADQFSRLGSMVTVVTSTPGPQVEAAYDIVRLPSTTKLYQLARNADICFQNNVSLRMIFPLLAAGKPVVVTHQTWLKRVDGGRGWQDYLKLAILRACHNIAISQAIASALPMPSLVVGNPFEPREFVDLGLDNRTGDVVFIGRLVSDKGSDLVLRALALLKREGLTPSFTVVGDGPEMPALKQLTAEFGLSDQVDFLGTVREGRGKIAARHKIMVVPSIWEEPFGVVALEGIAAGCAVVATRAGGLPEAVGPCGILFPNGDVAALASALKKLITSSSLRNELIAGRNQHLQQFQPEAVAKRYLEVFACALR
jgi:glycosyltransferase involved in cell wall biosynthesis